MLSGEQEARKSRRGHGCRRSKIPGGSRGFQRIALQRGMREEVKPPPGLQVCGFGRQARCAGPSGPGGRRRVGSRLPTGGTADCQSALRGSGLHGLHGLTWDGSNFEVQMLVGAMNHVGRSSMRGGSRCCARDGRTPPKAPGGSWRAFNFELRKRIGTMNLKQKMEPSAANCTPSPRPSPPREGGVLTLPGSRVVWLQFPSQSNVGSWRGGQNVLPYRGPSGRWNLCGRIPRPLAWAKELRPVGPQVWSWRSWRTAKGEGRGWGDKWAMRGGTLSCVLARVAPLDAARTAQAHRPYQPAEG